MGTVFICGGIQGYQAGVGDLRKAPACWSGRCGCCWCSGGFALATPGGGIVPLSQVQMTGLGLALLLPTLALAYLLVRRRHT